MDSNKIVSVLQSIKLALWSKREDTNIEHEVFTLIDSLIEFIQGSSTDYLKYSDIVNNLTSTEVQKVLSAAQGKALSDMIADYTSGILFYGGTVDGTGVCTLSDKFKERFGIESLIMTADNAPTYNGAYFVCSTAGTSGVPGTLGTAQNDWIVASETAWGKMSDSTIEIISNAEIDSLN